jgi:hypothetical protein
MFRSGLKKLEKSIAEESGNAELRFLRLMIQENAPGILNYRNEIEEDSKMVRSAYKKLPKVVQQAVSDYSKKSKVLKPEYF